MTEYRIVEKTRINLKKEFFIEYKGWFGIWHKFEFGRVDYPTKQEAERALNSYLTPKVIHEYKKV